MKKGDTVHATLLGQDGVVIDMDQRRVRLDLPPTADRPDGSRLWVPKARTGPATQRR